MLLCQCQCRKYLVLWFSLTFIKNINLYWDLKFQYLYTLHIYICIHTCLLTSFHPNYHGFKVMFYLIESPSKNHSIFPLDWASLMFQTVKEPAWNVEDPGLIPGLERSMVKGILQYSSLENSMYRGGCWATVHGVTKSRTWLSN